MNESVSHRIDNLSLSLDESLTEVLTNQLGVLPRFRILRESIDARKGRPLRRIFSIEILNPNESLMPPSPKIESVIRSNCEVAVVGAGPAGIFAALRLAERGARVHLFEQGSVAEKRIGFINRFWRHGELHPLNNVGFGEGGAGMYSDGKLITRIKSPHIPYVMHRLVESGAPAEILYRSNPHVGSDKIRRILPKLRERLRLVGVNLHFDTPVTSLRFHGQRALGVVTKGGEFYPSEHIVLCCGHSARELHAHLFEQGVFIEGKSFAVGFRIEHPQAWLNNQQYREWAAHPALGAASYRLTDHDHASGVGVYSFCMCPGGYVLHSATAAGQVVSNGMSNFSRGSAFANSALVVSIDYPSWFGADPHRGIEFIDEIEMKAYEMVKQANGQRQLPAQRAVDFLTGTPSRSPLEKGSSPSGYVPARLDQLLPRQLHERLEKSLYSFAKQMPGFLSEQAVLVGVESRTSAPVRITRHGDNFQSLSHFGLYPCGEGAGYAGGITSAACDGVRVAEAITDHLAGATPARTMNNE